MHQLNDWETTWRRSRLPGLGPNLTSFIFKVAHDLLPTKERLSKVDSSKSSSCEKCSAEATEDLVHALIQCDFNGGVGKRVISCISDNQTQNPAHFLHLNFDADRENELSTMWILALVWQDIWDRRMKNQAPELFTTRAKLEAHVSILRKTRRYQNDATRMESIINLL